MSNRKSLSQKTRFEVFKRDGFCCIYCGSHPPSAILHIDHIIAVVNGGTNDLDNLVTACQRCNQGKGARELDNAPQALDDRAEEIKEKESQLAAYRALMTEKKARIEHDVNSIVEIYESFNEGYTLDDHARRSIARFLESLDVDEIVDVADLSFGRGKGFRYFCAVCWNKIRDRENTHVG